MPEHHTPDSPELRRRIAGSLPLASGEANAGELLSDLFETQRREWPQCREGYDSFLRTKNREVSVGGSTVWLQFNPGRIVSTGARVDERSIRERPCFLCVEDLPSQQKGLSFHGDTLILCNPNPIFERHFTASHINHVPQELGPNVERFLSLAEAVSPDYSVFYNGPRCGASAPDHLHFQLSPKESIPVERDSEDKLRLRELKVVRSVKYCTIPGYGRSVIVLHASSRDSIADAIAAVIKALKAVSGADGEPMLNLLCSVAGRDWKVVIFPRRKHRPEIYFAPEGKNVMVSPALVDLGGLVITPLLRDFENLDGKSVGKIFAEVSLDETMTEAVIATL